MNNEFTLFELNLLSVTLYQAIRAIEGEPRHKSPAEMLREEQLNELHHKVYAMLEARCEELDREVKHARNEVEKEKEKKVTFMHGDEELTMLITIL